MPKDLPDFRRAPNIAADPHTYEAENEAIERDGRLDAALAELAPWRGRTLLDVGCGTGYWLPGYAETAAHVIGVEPDQRLLGWAVDRTATLANVEARYGSAEHLPLDDDSVDVVHARFAYFWGAGSEAGLDEVRRVLRPGGVLAVVDNGWGASDVTALLTAATGGNADVDHAAVRAWWQRQGAVRHGVAAGWHAQDAAELEQCLRLEFPGEVVDGFLVGRPPTATLTADLAVFVLRT